MALYLENIGGCKDSINRNVCVYPENKLYIPNSFTPNYDNCNDEFYAKGLGGFRSFNISIYNRWSSELIFESDEIILTNQMEDGNLCNNISNEDSYYKMGSWDGIMINGLPAPKGVYPFVINYKEYESELIKQEVGYVVLIK